jgi:ubiquinone/menaquinone biosynthesis C-methylase UbiE
MHYERINMSSQNQYQDPNYLRHDQYRDSRHLEARIALHRQFSTGETDWFDWVWQKLALRPGERVLECGCGPGGLWVYNRERIPAGCAITLTDLSPGMVAEAEAALGDLPNFRFEVANIEQLPFADSSFDVVVANHMLYHVPHLDEALAEVKRVLAKDGHFGELSASRFFCATNGNDHMRELTQLGRSHHVPLHFRSTELAFRLENGTDLLRPYFSQVERHDYDSHLAVTEVEPLVAYALSYGEARQKITPEQIEALRQYVSDTIANQGHFHITKATGLFIGRP